MKDFAEKKVQKLMNLLLSYFSYLKDIENLKIFFLKTFMTKLKVFMAKSRHTSLFNLNNLGHCFNSEQTKYFFSLFEKKLLQISCNQGLNLRSKGQWLNSISFRLLWEKYLTFFHFNLDKFRIGQILHDIYLKIKDVATNLNIVRYRSTQNSKSTQS